MGALRDEVGTPAISRRKPGARSGWSTSRCSSFDPDSRQWKARHHPFTSPKDGHEQYIESAPQKAYAKAYDMVLNGWEIGGGSVRIHRQEIQQTVFRALKMTGAEQRAKFGFLLDALQFGAPPHGIAFGFDRLVTLMAGAAAIRDVIAFPKTSAARISSPARRLRSLKTSCASCTCA